MTALAPPSPEAMRNLTAVAAAPSYGSRRAAASVEYLRKDAKGRAIETRYAIVSRPDELSARQRRLVDPHDAHASAAYQTGPNFFSWFGHERRTEQRSPGFFGNSGRTQPSGPFHSPFQFQFR
jgi:hypothetical protein